ncbi:efflux RND transporter periplasmic adaptor subunit [Alteromonadaceae bacterium M269]|nr:efflux RND transporter periplasmic adaptor subunit [Alteromonadaceae bacterium M269]
MKSIEQRYGRHMTTLNSLSVPKLDRLIARLTIFIITIVCLVLWFTPWVQTSMGEGVVSTLDPKSRTQAISALVPGQIETWHVTEGDKVKKGDPIVTLIDTDPSLIQRLNAQIEATQRQQNANDLALKNAEQDFKRRQDLYKQGLVSKREVEQAQIRLQSAEAKSAQTQAELNQAKVNLARQSIQTKRAPADGTILRLMSAGNATFVKAGDMLASFIPDGVERTVVLNINGLDAPLVTPGRQVRLQFDGWPVFQFSGWPSAAIGTFEGVVEFIEPIADAQGSFRVWVKESTTERPWPNDKYVRLGSRVKGWVLLEEVQLGYELWRQLNSFPPKYPEQTP